MKRSALLVLIIIILIVGFFHIEGLIPFIFLNDTVLESVFQAIYQDAATIALLALVVILLAFLLFFRDISRAFGNQRQLKKPRLSVNDSRIELSLERRFEFTERALYEFAEAMETYAEHMASHTSAIQGLSEASHALKSSAAEQNRILGHLSESIIRDRTNREISILERLVSRFESNTTEALLARDVLESGIGEDIIDEIRVKKEIKPPPGCVVNPKALASRPRYSE